MDGREKCRALRQLRDDIARQNGIELKREACTYEGECSGTCPRCDAELEALTRELEKRGVRVPEEAVAIEPGNDIVLMGEAMAPDEWFGFDESPWN